MRLELGPIPSQEVLDFVDYARGVLGELGPDGTAPLVDRDTAKGFDHFFDAWEKAARRAKTFRWSEAVEPELVEYLVVGWQRLSAELDRRDSQRGAARDIPGEAFVRMLLQTVLAALDAEGRATRGFAEHVRDVWPGASEGRVTGREGRNPA